MFLRKAEDKHDVNYVSLLRCIRKGDEVVEGEEEQKKMYTRYTAHNRVFNKTQERSTY